MTAAAERAAPRVALVAGAVGRFGEALLNRVLGSGDYRMVVALAQAPILSRHAEDKTPKV